METEAKYRLDTDENKAFLKELRENLFAFGVLFPSPEGSAYYLGDDRTPQKDRPRETWITARMAHVYSLAVLLKRDQYANLADVAFRGIQGELTDAGNGGYYAGITANGEVLPSKQCYAHAFVMLAASSGILAGRPGADKLLEKVRITYDRRFWEEAKGLSLNGWDTEFTKPEEYRGLNANMHSVEAFLAVADATGEEMYRQRAGRIIGHVMEWARKFEYRLPEHFSAEWKPMPEYNRDNPRDPFLPYGATPGHGMEWARLIVQWALSTAKKEGMNLRQAKFSPDYAIYFETAERLYQRAKADGWNADGAPGFVYTTDWKGVPVVHDRMHWTLAEAINTAAVLYRVTGAEIYFNDYAMYMKYLEEKVLDTSVGSWYHQLNLKNEVIGTVWPGKPDLYHAVQATLIPYADPAVSVAAELKNRA